MNSTNARSLVRRSTVAALVAGATLLLGACSTAPIAREPADSEKSVTYAVLHGDMERLAHESADWGAARPIEATLASNP